MKKKTKKYKSVITRRIFQSMRKIGLVFVILFFAFSYGKISGTNAFFTNKVTFNENMITAGYWIPHLNMAVDPTDPDGSGGWYQTEPCVTLTTSITDPANTIIYYRLKNTDSYVQYSGSCVEIPDGEWDFDAYALYDNNPDWKSNLVGQNFKVNTQLVEAGDVIINEVMWMGSDGKPLDQWVELKNVSDKDVHLKDWYLTYKSNAGNELMLLEIKDNRVIKKGEYLLFSYYTKNNSAIDVQPDDDGMNDFGYQKFQIKLYTNSAKTRLIDVAGDGTQEPKEGDKDKYYSMERNNTPSDGADYKNWHTCLDSTSTGLYWDSGRLEQGTPGHENLSENDPSHIDKAVEAGESEDVIEQIQVTEATSNADNILPIDENIINDPVGDENSEDEDKNSKEEEKDNNITEDPAIVPEAEIVKSETPIIETEEIASLIEPEITELPEATETEQESNEPETDKNLNEEKAKPEEIVKEPETPKPEPPKEDPPAEPTE